MLTKNCNLRCKFCFEQEAGYCSNDNIDYLKLTKLIDFCNESKVKYLLLSGGEPTLYPNLIEILNYIKYKNYGIQPALVTNGIRLSDKAFCRKLIDNGITYIDISLKGNSSVDCINNTGVDCIESQLKAIKNLATLNAEFTCSMVITHDNVDSFCDTVELAYNSGGKQFSFTLVIDNVKSECSENQYLRENDPVLLVEKFIAQIDKLDNITRGEWWLEYTFPLCVFSDNQLSMLEGKLASYCHVFEKNCIVLDTKMNLLPCDMYMDDKMGVFYDDFRTYTDFLTYSQRDIYKNVTDLLQKPPSEECMSCVQYEKCRGGCPVFWKNFSFDSFMNFINDKKKCV